MSLPGRSQALSPLWSSLVLGALLLPARGLSAPADSTLIWDVVLAPEHPCQGDSVTLFVRAFESTPCEQFLGVEGGAGGPVIIRTLFNHRIDCIPPPSFAVPVALGRFAAGSHRLKIVLETIEISPGWVDTLRQEDFLDFEVAASCPTLPVVPAGELPFVNRIGTQPSPPCPDRPTNLVVAGAFRDGCGRLVGSEVVDPGHVGITLAPYPPRPTGCPAVLMPWSATLPLGLLEPGFHRTEILLTVLGTAAVWPPIPTQRYRGVFDFTVPSSCDSVPGPLPFVDFIRVQPLNPCRWDQTICPNDSIMVLIGGRFPNECFRVRRVDLLPSIQASPLPEPPIVRVVVDDGGCLDQLCLPRLQPWSASVTLPPLPARDYQLTVQLAKVTCTDSVPPANYPTTQVPFKVVATNLCPANPCACFLWGWDRSQASGECHARTSPGRPADVTLQILSSAALAGLEGRFNISPPGLRVTKVEAVGPAAGMHLSWTRTSDGARFVMFADQGAPIPASSDPVSVLRITAELNPGAPRTTYYVNAIELLGSDVNGGAVERCLVRLDPRIADLSARICAARDCDFNADGRTDVRDLVLMVHCVNGAPCPIDPTRFDCDQDGNFDLADVICCAMEILRAPTCPDCPVDTVRVEPGVVVRFGDPRQTPTGLEVPIHLGSPWAIGAARLKIRFPADRFRVLGVESMADLELHEVAEDAVMVGVVGPWAIVDLAPGAPVPGDITLRLGLKPGQRVGGEVMVLEGEFSGPDGVMLDVGLGSPRQSLAGPSPIALSPARPNPFSGVTQFAVELAAPAEVEVGIYDVTGRQVAALFRGPLPAGTHPMVWNGRMDGGGSAREGVYFYRASAAGQSRSGKLVLLKGR